MISLLIVEDNAKMRRMLTSLLVDLASAIYECEDGAEALAAYAAHRPDWVLMDIAMKNLDGISATREIKAAFPDAHICIVTQYDDSEMREEAHRAGAEGYVTKDDLIAVRQVLGPRGL